MEKRRCSDSQCRKSGHLVSIEGVFLVRIGYVQRARGRPDADSRFAFFIVVADEPGALTANVAAFCFSDRHDSEGDAETLSRDVPIASVTKSVHRPADRSIRIEREMQFSLGFPRTHIVSRCQGPDFRGRQPSSSLAV